MAMSKDDIKRDIENHINKHGGIFSDWYVGITDDPERRLEEHKVKARNKSIDREATSDTAAREVEDYFHDKKGCQGDGGGGDENSVHVYAYETDSQTEE